MQIKTSAAYIRVSTDEQLEFSPDSQIKKIKEYAERNKIELSDEFIFIDEGISGRKAEKRPAFMNMISIAKTKPKPFDVILVWKFSRFARNREDSIIYKSMLRKDCGIDVVSISEQIGEDKTAILIEALLEAMDEYYSINLAEEVKRGMNEKFSRGGVVSQPPFGYEMGDNVFVPNKETMQIVNMIFEDYFSGMGIRKIAMKLNDMGIRSSKGNLFENRTVEYILANPIYIGKLRRNLNGRDTKDRYHQSNDNIIVDGQHEPIISEKLFNDVNEKLRENKKNYIKYSKTGNADFMLRGLVRCSNCGSTLIQAVKGVSLQCNKYARGQCELSHSITISKINEAVLTKIREDLQNNEMVFEIKQQKSSGQKLLNDILIEKEQKKLLRIKEAFEAGIDTLHEYKLNKARILTQIDKLSTEKSQLQSEQIVTSIKKNANEIIQYLRSDKIAENIKNEILRIIISKIVFNRKDMTIQIFYRL